mmetsp:Transcript_36184/g.76807  ORF Transcript_36184/g.76807 Transcript_36184/m.76807 type:complete len:229 (+) Transcript_36184:31-717(+)
MPLALAFWNRFAGPSPGRCPAVSKTSPEPQPPAERWVDPNLDGQIIKLRGMLTRRENVLAKRRAEWTKDAVEKEEKLLANYRRILGEMLSQQKEQSPGQSSKECGPCLSVASTRGSDSDADSDEADDASMASPVAKKSTLSGFEFSAAPEVPAELHRGEAARRPEPSCAPRWADGDGVATPRSARGGAQVGLMVAAVSVAVLGGPRIMRATRCDVDAVSSALSSLLVQ